MEEQKVEGIKITIQVEAGTESITAVAEPGYQDENVAIYIDKQHRVWGLGEAIALATLDTYGERSQSEMIGKSDYIIIFDGDSVIQSGYQKFIFGDCLIMKSDHGLKCLTEEEVNEAMREYGSRLTRMNMGGFCFTGYPLL